MVKHFTAPNHLFSWDDGHLPGYAVLFPAAAIPVSAVFSFLRTFVFQLSTVLLLSKLLGLNDIWRTKAVAEVVSFLASFSF